MHIACLLQVKSPPMPFSVTPTAGPLALQGLPSTRPSGSGMLSHVTPVRPVFLEQFQKEFVRLLSPRSQHGHPLA